GGDAVGVPLQPACRLAGGEVPQGDRPVLRGGGEEFAVGAEGDGADLDVAGELADQLAGGGGPEADPPLVMPGGQDGGVGGEGEGGHPGQPPGDGAQQLAGGGVPDGQVVGGGGEEAGVGAEAPEDLQVAGGVPAEFLAG